MSRILVIDDDEQVRAMLKTLLEKAGYKVETASDGEEGLQLFRRGALDLVITDIVMPEKEGIETILAIREESPLVKIVAISGGGRVAPEHYLNLADSVGANRTFAKPVRSAELLAAIKELLEDD